MNERILDIEKKLELLAEELHEAETSVWETFKEANTIKATPESMPMIELLIQEKISKYSEMIKYTETAINELEIIKSTLHDLDAKEGKSKTMFRQSYEKARSRIKPLMKKIRNILKDEIWSGSRSSSSLRKDINSTFKSIQRLIRQEIE